MEACRLPGPVDRQPDLSQRDAVQGRREHGVRKRQASPTSIVNRQTAPDPLDRPPPPAAPAPRSRDAAAPSPAAGAEAARPLDAATKRKPADNADFRKTADAILIESFDVAKKIDRLIWKYRAMVRIALLAADSEQYARGFELARGIENGESRAEAMLLLAEAQTPRRSERRRDGLVRRGRQGRRHGAARRPSRRAGGLRRRQPDRQRTLSRCPQVHRALSRPGAAAGCAGSRRRVTGQRGGRRSRPASGSPPRFPKNSARPSTAGSPPASCRRSSRTEARNSSPRSDAALTP